ncbi:MAG: hypothetical protein LUB59_01290, partial [Candidatus Gastranaerophilales bacterium]|nr:hypothetical protein [Candidatus Gastranaerophilales bacterium]
PERQPKPEKIKPEKPVKVAEVKPVRQPKPEKIKLEKPVKVAGVKPVKPVEPERQPKPEKIKPEKPVKVVSRTTSDATAAFSSQQGVYNYPAAQEVPVSSSFEMFQSRLPLTRKPFDDEECMYR